jgi:hypothetical protein
VLICREEETAMSVNMEAKTSEVSWRLPTTALASHVISGRLLKGSVPLSPCPEDGGNDDLE